MITAGRCLWFPSGPSADRAVGPLSVPPNPKGSIQIAKEETTQFSDSSLCGSSVVFFHTSVFPYA